MTLQRLARNAFLVLAVASLSACGGGIGSSNLFGGGRAQLTPPAEAVPAARGRQAYFQGTTQTTLRDLVGGVPKPVTMTPEKGSTDSMGRKFSTSRLAAQM